MWEDVPLPGYSVPTTTVNTSSSYLEPVVAGPSEGFYEEASDEGANRGYGQVNGHAHSYLEPSAGGQAAHYEEPVDTPSTGGYECATAHEGTAHYHEATELSIPGVGDTPLAPVAMPLYDGGESSDADYDSKFGAEGVLYDQGSERVPEGVLYDQGSEGTLEEADYAYEQEARGMAVYDYGEAMVDSDHATKVHVGRGRSRPRSAAPEAQNSDYEQYEDSAQGTDPNAAYAQNRSQKRCAYRQATSGQQCKQSVALSALAGFALCRRHMCWTTGCTNPKASAVSNCNACSAAPGHTPGSARASNIHRNRKPSKYEGFGVVDAQC